MQSVLQLEPWQTQQILALRNHFWELQNSVLTERQKVEASLQASLSARSLGTWRLPGGCSALHYWHPLCQLCHADCEIVGWLTSQMRSLRSVHLYASYAIHRPAGCSV